MDEHVAISSNEAKNCLSSPKEEIKESSLLSKISFVVSCNGIFVNNDSTSKLAMVTGVSNSKEDITLANSAELFTVYSLVVKGLIMGTRNLAVL